MPTTQVSDSLHIGYATDFPPELSTDPSYGQELDHCWPKFFDIGDIGITAFLSDDPWMRQFQIMVIHKAPNSSAMRVVATGHSVPFHWPKPQENNSLPDGGWNAVRSVAMKQHYFRNNMTEKLEAFKDCPLPDIPYIGEPAWDIKYDDYEAPNVLCAIAVCILPEFRALGLSERIIGLMRDKCIAEGYQAFIVPVRPTRKAEFKKMPMSTYLQMSRNHESKVSQDGNSLTSKDTFDPWIRKHMSLGGTPVKIANNSMIFRASAKAWDESAEKLGMCQKAWKEGKVQKNEYNNEEYVNVYDVPGTLGPVRYYLKRDEGVYCESNVWIRHI
ncbi:hypothetical protein H072_6 [Dactylellina haptotyla CBS 200.50]|uniref:Uncharacterized protein n=1 Tax=Dactylellina haptotyla (strain CBS 200.50) TaxID=1284197 RepID=S8ASH8_DACHA|nr:hypothetical protein H072_6 [Dactylellina haptotyla CBS 200.50]